VDLRRFKFGVAEFYRMRLCCGKLEFCSAMWAHIPIAPPV
jgi:hypothetical protein